MKTPPWPRCRGGYAAASPPSPESATQPRSIDATEQRLTRAWRQDEDLPVAEIARRLGRSASAVARVVRHARGRVINYTLRRASWSSSPTSEDAPPLLALPRR